MEEDVKKHSPLHKDLAKAQMKKRCHSCCIWFEENNPFDHDRDKQLLVSFSTGFNSTANDGVNTERATEIGREMQKKLFEQSIA